MCKESKVFLEGSVNINENDWSKKAVLGNPGTGVYGSGNSEGVYAITDGSPDSYGLKALHGGGAGAIYSQGNVHLMEGKVGIDTQNPTEKLEVNGAIKVGGREETGAAAGTIRWNSEQLKLQVFDGNSWINLH